MTTSQAEPVRMAEALASAHVLDYHFCDLAPDLRVIWLLISPSGVVSGGGTFGASRDDAFQVCLQEGDLTPFFESSCAFHAVYRG